MDDVVSEAFGDGVIDRGDGAGDEVMALEMLVFYLLSLFILFLYAILTFTFVVGVTTRRNVCVDASIRQREHRRSHLTETTSPTTPTYFFTLRRIPSVEVTTRRNACVDASIRQRASPKPPHRDHRTNHPRRSSAAHETPSLLADT